MSKPCSLSGRPTHWFLGDLLCSPEPVLKGGNATLNVISQKKISVKVVLFLTKRGEMGTDAQLAWLDFYLDFLVISPPQYDLLGHPPFAIRSLWVQRSGPRGCAELAPSHTHNAIFPSVVWTNFHFTCLVWFGFDFKWSGDKTGFKGLERWVSKSLMSYSIK